MRIIIAVMLAGSGLAFASCTEQSAPVQETDAPATEYRGTYLPDQSVASTPTGGLGSVEGFRNMDRDGDGSISLTELQLLDNSLSETDFQRFDKDDSKSLNFDEFGAWRAAAAGAAQPGAPREDGSSPLADPNASEPDGTSPEPDSARPSPAQQP